MRKVVSLLIIVSFLLFIPIGVKAAAQFDITGPAGSERFGFRERLPTATGVSEPKGTSPLTTACGELRRAAALL